jgi:pimeloyl-ACP methyl ester carboxylesterase
MAEADLTTEERDARLKRFDIETRFPYLFADREAGKKALAEIFRDTRFSWAHSEYTDRVFTFIDFRDRLPRIRARSLVIAGRHDLLPVEKAQEIASGIAGARLVVFERSGHFAPVEEREEFVRTVVGFLRATRGS